MRFEPGCLTVESPLSTSVWLCIPGSSKGGHHAGCWDAMADKSGLSQLSWSSWYQEDWLPMKHSVNEMEMCDLDRYYRKERYLRALALSGALVLGICCEV